MPIAPMIGALVTPSGYAAERGAYNPAYKAGALVAALVLDGTGHEIGLPFSYPLGCHPRELMFGCLTHLNGGTVSAGKFKVDVSWDGLNWIDSGGSEATVATTDGGVAVVKLAVYIAAHLLPARYARVHISTAVTAGAGAPSFDFFLVL